MVIYIFRPFHFEISQMKDETTNKYKATVKLNGKIIVNEENENAQSTENAELFISSASKKYIALKCTIESFQLGPGNFSITCINELFLK